MCRLRRKSLLKRKRRRKKRLFCVVLTFVCFLWCFCVFSCFLVCLLYCVLLVLNFLHNFIFLCNFVLYIYNVCAKSFIIFEKFLLFLLFILKSCRNFADGNEKQKRFSVHLLIFIIYLNSLVMKKTEKSAKVRKVLSVTVENFAVIRETLKSGEECKVNDKVTLTSYLPNTERLSDNGKKVRTPFYYIADDGTKHTSTTLKNLLGLECETKGERKATTFASVWEQLEKLADTATAKELQDAAKVLQEKAKAKAKVEAEEKAAKIADLEAQLAALRG